MNFGGLVFKIFQKYKKYCFSCFFHQCGLIINLSDRVTGTEILRTTSSILPTTDSKFTILVYSNL